MIQIGRYYRIGDDRVRVTQVSRSTVYTRHIADGEVLAYSPAFFEEHAVEVDSKGFPIPEPVAPAKPRWIVSGCLENWPDVLTFLNALDLEQAMTAKVVADISFYYVVYVAKES